MNTSGAGSEHAHQATLCNWWRLACRNYGLAEKLLFAVPNGGVRNYITAARLKAEGVRAGVPDMFLAVPSGDKAGLFLEMKRPRTSGGQVPRKSQTEMMQLLEERGYQCSVCFGAQEAVATIVTYLRPYLESINRAE